MFCQRSLVVFLNLFISVIGGWVISLSLYGWCAIYNGSMQTTYAKHTFYINKGEYLPDMLDIPTQLTCMKLGNFISLYTVYTMVNIQLDIVAGWFHTSVFPSGFKRRGGLSTLKLFMPRHMHCSTILCCMNTV